MKPCWIQLTQHLSSHDMNVRFEFYLDVQQMMEKESFADKLVFSDESTFHKCSKIKTPMSVFGGRILRKWWLISVISLKFMFLLLCHYHECIAHFSSRRQMLLALPILTCCNCGWCLRYRKIMCHSFSSNRALSYYLNDICYFLNNELLCPRNNELLPPRIGRDSDNDNCSLLWLTMFFGPNSMWFFYGVTTKIMCLCPLWHLIYKIYTKGS